MKLIIITALLLSAVAATAQADIYKCIIDGTLQYQAHPCPAHAEQAVNASHLEDNFTPEPINTPLDLQKRVYKDRSQYVEEDRELSRRDRLLLLREAEHEKARLAREQARLDALRHIDQRQAAKEDRDERWREDQIRRKARNSNDYFYIDTRGD